MSRTADQLDLDVFNRYAGLSLPRHVSYPMPTWWRPMDPDQIAALHERCSRSTPQRDLSLYLHVPFCETLCKFCACNKVIQRKDATGAQDRTDRYVAALVADVTRRAAGFGPRGTSSVCDSAPASSRGSGTPLRQVHFGGGSPLYLSNEHLERIRGAIAESFDLSPDAEIAMEIDPRNAQRERLRFLRRLGFNRVSMGVQDFDQQVQKHVRRVQPFDQVREVVETCRELGFASVNFDLIYGLPYQTPETIRDTVGSVIDLAPDRIAYYHYAQIPEKIATQRGIDHTKLPDSRAKLDMFLIGVAAFESAGYEFIGLDHFAKPSEALATAGQSGTLQRNFQGMTTGGGLHLLGAGVSAISHLLGVGFLQNVKDTDGYMERVEQGGSPGERGLALSRDDLIRQAVINEIYCVAGVDPCRIETRFDIEFADYFARELNVLRELQRDGLVELDPDGSITLTDPLGRVLMRNVAAVFDAYLDPEAYRRGETVCFSTNA